MTVSIKRMVDRLGELKASIAIQSNEADDIIRRLKSRGLGVYSGVLFDANIFATQRATVDWKGLAAHLGYSMDQRQQFTSMSTITTCKVTARLTRGG